MVQGERSHEQEGVDRDSLKAGGNRPGGHQPCGLSYIGSSYRAAGHIAVAGPSENREYDNSCGRTIGHQIIEEQGPPQINLFKVVLKSLKFQCTAPQFSF
eukprot:sb/3478603/